VLLLLALCVTGCSHTRGQVIALGNPGVIALSADDIARVMQRAGFSDDQILELGTDLRNSLATSGAAQIRVGDKVEAIYAVDGTWVYISSRLRGSAIYDCEAGRFR